MNADDSRSPVAEHSAGERASEAFELLGNETRLEILLALWESIDPFDEEDAVTDAVRTALDAGYTHVDTAEGYHNEAAIGDALADYDRDDYFLTSKVLPKHLDYESVIES